MKCRITDLKSRLSVIKRLFYSVMSTCDLINQCNFTFRMGADSIKTLTEYGDKKYGSEYAMEIELKGRENA
jgi:hypothetical protein